jgi:hypothetical protein
MSDWRKTGADWRKVEACLVSTLRQCASAPVSYIDWPLTDADTCPPGVEQNYPPLAKSELPAMRCEIRFENREYAKFEGTFVRFDRCPADAARCPANISVALLRAAPMTVAAAGQSRAATGAKSTVGLLPAPAHLKGRPAPTRPGMLGAPAGGQSTRPSESNAPAAAARASWTVPSCAATCSATIRPRRSPSCTAGLRLTSVSMVTTSKYASYIMMHLCSKYSGLALAANHTHEPTYVKAYNQAPLPGNKPPRLGPIRCAPRSHRIFQISGI